MRPIIDRITLAAVVSAVGSLDRDLKAAEYLIMQAGTHTESIKIRREEWERACHPIAANTAAS